jgi:hypothetical protein
MEMLNCPKCLGPVVKYDDGTTPKGWKCISCKTFYLTKDLVNAIMTA